MKLIREYFELCEGGICQDLLTEEEKIKVKNGTTYLSGLMQEAEKLNGNGRLYSRQIMEREVQNYKKLVDERRALGELDHPDDSVINLKNCSHLVIDLWMDGCKVMGKIEVLNTPAGNILQSLVRSGVKMGISSRGMGSIREQNGKTIVEDDFQLICFDMVSDPSTQGAFMVTEAKRTPNIFTKADKINRIMNDILS
jgi:hypothetical protein